MKANNHLEDLDRVGIIYLQEIGEEGMNWINLAQDEGKWLAAVNTVMNFCDP